MTAIPEELRSRDDFMIIPSDTRGLGLNRSIALERATADIVLISDDDINYRPEYLERVMQAFDERPDFGFITFRYHSDCNPREYPDYEFDFTERPKDYFFGGPEIAFRLAPVREAGITFDARFGVGAEFPSGEDDLFVNAMLKAGIRGCFVPLTIADHEHTSTAMRMDGTPSFIRVKGAVHSIIHPHTWPLRMITHSLRHKGGLASRIRYCKAWLSGVTDLRK
jgi:glycosyltransferase involved in cell wall biosynthesis